MISHIQINRSLLFSLHLLSQIPHSSFLLNIDLPNKSFYFLHSDLCLILIYPTPLTSLAYRFCFSYFFLFANRILPLFIFLRYPQANASFIFILSLFFFFLSCFCCFFQITSLSFLFYYSSILIFQESSLFLLSLSHLSATHHLS